MARSLACIVVLALSLGACSGTPDHENYAGTLYFSSGQTLYAMNLQNRQVTSVYENHAMIINSLEKLDDQHLLVGYERLSPFGKLEEQIVNLVNGNATTYGEGMQIENLRYLPQLKVVVFAGIEARSDRWALYWANVDTPFRAHLIDDAAVVGSILVISDHQILYTLGTLGGDFRIKMYDFETHRSSLLNIADCNPILWRSRTAQLVCQRKNGAGPYYLLDLDDSGRQEIHLGILNGGLYMVWYIKSYDAAVLTSYGGLEFSFRRGVYEDSELYLYEFQTKKLVKISDRYSANASQGSVVWYPSVQSSFLSARPR